MKRDSTKINKTQNTYTSTHYTPTYTHTLTYQMTLPILLLTRTSMCTCMFLTLIISISATSFAEEPLIPSPTFRRDVTCSGDYGKASEYDGSSPSHSPQTTNKGFVEGCHPKVCNRLIYDDFLDEKGVTKLTNMANKAINAGRGGGERPGPTIVDINSGFMRDDEGLVMIYEGAEGEALFTAEEYKFYGDVIERIRRTVGAENGLDEGFPVFTAPTFITRIKYDADWRPRR